MPVSRSRHGKPVRLASCEPCRLSKLACDHRRPVCSRCSRKDRQGECVYRTHPFKRGRQQQQQQQQQQAALPPPPPPPPLPGPLQAWSVTDPSPGSSTTPRDPQVLQLTIYPNPGFQGSSSLSTILGTIEQEPFTNHGGPIGSPHREPGGDDDVDDAETGDGGDVGSMFFPSSTTMIEEGAQVLDSFADSLVDGTFQKLFDGWTSSGLQSHLGAMLVSSFFDSIDHVVAILRRAADRREGLLHLSRQLFGAGRVPVRVSETTSLHDFIAQHTGQNLRWEALGTVLAMAGIAATEIRAPHPMCASERERHSLRKCLVDASSRCVSFCDSLDVLNDVQIVFQYETFLLYSVYYGDQSFQTWRRLNDAITALFARGLHQRLDKDPRTTPFFLVELRKHIFSRIYASDISFAVFLGRPPRMSQRHCVMHVPLDITREAYYRGGSLLKGQLELVDAKGWNTIGEVRSYAVLRWSLRASMIREDTLDVILGPDLSNKDHRISALRVKIEEAWSELPPYLAVPASQVWDRDRSSTDIDSLYLIRLFYLQAIFLIEWTASIHGTVDPDALYIIAGDLLSWVNEAILRRDRMRHTGSISMAWRIAACGLPAAGALARCMAPGSPQPSRKWQSPAAQAKVVQNISVLMGHMEYIHEPEDGNYRLFRQARAILKGVVASILHPPHALQAATPVTEPSPMSSLSDPMLDQWALKPDFWIGLPGPADFEFF